jgi:Ricin-type beta-trefoil lectin domain
MMRGIRRLVVGAAATGLLTMGAVGASPVLAHADAFAAACGGNTANGFICNIDTTITSPGSLTVTADSGEFPEAVNVNWSVTCTDSSGSVPSAGATDNAETPLTVQLMPLPANAGDSSCSVNVGMTLPAHPVGPEIDYTGELDYTPAGTSTSSAPTVHPIVGFGGKCADDKGNSSANKAAIIIWSCSGSDSAENWSFSNGELVHNGKCMNDKGSGGKGTSVILYSCNGGSNEKWSHLSNGEFKLSAHGGTLCLDDPRSSTKNGTQLIVYTCSDSANQRWTQP